MTDLCKGDTMVFYWNISSVFLQCVHNIARWYQCSICTTTSKDIKLKKLSLHWREYHYYDITTLATHPTIMSIAEYWKPPTFPEIGSSYDSVIIHRLGHHYCTWVCGTDLQNIGEPQKSMHL